MKNNKGIALILVVSLLMALVTIGTSLVTMANMQREAAANEVFYLKTKLTSYAGIDSALAHLYRCFAKDNWYGKLPQYNIQQSLWYYGGEDLNGNEFIDPAPFGEEGEVTRETDEAGDGPACPLEKAFAPSFTTGTYQTPSLLGQGYSGKITDSKGELTYVLKIRDFSALIPILPKEDTHTLKILQALDKVLKTNFDMQAALTAYRASNNFTQSSLEKFFPQKISKYLTAYFWLDENTIAPPQFDIHDFNRNPGTIRYKKIDIAPRAPININTASFEVLVSCLMGLSARVVRPGYFIHESDAGALSEMAKMLRPKRSAEEMEKFEEATLTKDKMEQLHLGDTTAYYIAEGIIQQRQRQSFRSWQDLAEFLAKLLPCEANKEFIDAINARLADRELREPNEEVQIPFSPQLASLVWANANPNSNLNKHNPDFPDSYLYGLWKTDSPPQKLFYRIDKTDLIKHTTEFCFYPTGYFQIENLSRYIVQGQLLNQSKRSIIVKLFDIHRITNQKDFSDLIADDSKNIAIYPETQLETAENCRYDGYISLVPRDLKDITFTSPPIFSQPFTSTVNGRKWQSLKIAPLVGKENNNYFVDGAYSDQKNVIAMPSALEPDGNTNTTTLLCFWYKPNWDIMDPLARPHSILDSNRENIDQLFQIYNESKVISLSPEKTEEDKATVDLFAFNRAGEPVKLALPLPEGISQNRWLFFSLFFNKNKVQLAVNLKKVERSNTVSLVTFHLFGAKGKGHLFFVGENLNFEFGSGENYEYVGGTLFGKATDKLKSFAKSMEHELKTLNHGTIALRQILAGSQSKNAVKPLEPTLKPLGRKPSGFNPRSLGSFFMMSDVLNSNPLGGSLPDHFYQKFWKLLEQKDPPFAEKLKKEVRSFTVMEMIGEVTDEVFSKLLQRQNSGESVIGIAISAQLLDINLGGRLKFVLSEQELLENNQELSTPKQFWLNAPSNGSYSNPTVFKLQGLDKETETTAEKISTSIFESGRYFSHSDKPMYLSEQISLNTKVHLGALRWSEYLPQNCKDFSQQGVHGADIKISLCDSTGNVLKGPFSSKDTSPQYHNSLDNLQAAKFCYKIEFESSGKTILAAPILDDLTLTYSSGWKIVQWQ